MEIIVAEIEDTKAMPITTSWSPTYMTPFCTTLLLHVVQQSQALLHSNINGGSCILNSGTKRPYCKGEQNSA
mgnify:CR=1 FL=1